jgi:hypothetical protein
MSDKKPSKANLKTAIEVLDHYVEQSQNAGQSAPFEQARYAMQQDAGLADDDD